MSTDNDLDDEPETSNPRRADVRIIRSQPNAQLDAKGPHPTSSEWSPFLDDNLFLPNSVPQYGPPFAPNGDPFPMQGPPQTMFCPPVPASPGPPDLYQHHLSVSMYDDPPDAYTSPSTVPTPATGLLTERNWQPANPYNGEHLPISGLNSVFTQSFSRADVPINLNKRGAHCIDVSSPSLAPENHKRSRLQRESYGASKSQPLRLGDQISGRPGKFGPDESPQNNSTDVGGGLTIPSRISISPIPTSFGDIFQYRPIQATEFRLIRLLPANMSMIRCEIIHASLEAEPNALRYIAVSYTWGDVDPDAKIQVDGCPFYITSNLHSALKRLRKQHESIMVWVDALCINQRNKEEQSEQVALMTAIYGRAESVAAWLGPESDSSALAFELIWKIYHDQLPAPVSNIIADRQWRPHFTAVVNLFERDFWSRLWIVQEIINAQNVFVYCGDSEVPWEVFQNVSALFKRHEADIKRHFPQGTTKGSRLGLSHAHTLCSQGPASLDILKPPADEGPEALLYVLRICRTKLAAEPRDKVFGILGILPQSVQYHIPLNYNASIREVYTNVVDLLLHTTRRVDIICDAIYYPVHTSTVKLPTWVPDWSFIPSTAALGSCHEFSAASDENAIFDFVDLQRTILKVAAIYIDALKIRGIAVGTFCTLDDYLMAFMHWQAKPFASLVADEVDPEVRKQKDEAFCQTLALGKVSGTQGTGTWMETCYYVFTSLISERLPSIILNDHLKAYANQKADILPRDRRNILQDNCASKMQGRCFFTTESGLMGMGSGFMNVGDIICVPLGCKTPIILRPEGNNEYRLVSDAYIDGYMNGESVREYEEGKRILKDYVLH
ncbi:heterokaryon incompatibility protein-domain-containing protein [Xylaria castorea]|nr:heterokaryon incompatibility protein-domain-containing protein [Xylaria castorea]